MPTSCKAVKGDGATDPHSELSIRLELADVTRLLKRGLDP